MHRQLKTRLKVDIKKGVDLFAPIQIQSKSNVTFVITLTLGKTVEKIQRLFDSVGDVFEFNESRILEKFDPNKDHLSISIEAKVRYVNFTDENIFKAGEKFIELFNLPQAIPYDYDPLPLENGSNENARLYLTLEAENFGIKDNPLFEIRQDVCKTIRVVSNPTDRLTNAVLVMKNLNVFYSLEDAIDDLTTQGTRGPMIENVVIIFPGKYMVMSPIKINDRSKSIVLFGAGSKDEVISVESYDPKGFLFELDGDVQLTLHNISFFNRSNNKIFFLKNKGAEIRLNNVDYSDVTVWKDNPNFKASNVTAEEEDRFVEVTDSIDPIADSQDNSHRISQLKKNAPCVVITSTYDFAIYQ